jgi:enoyl-CoA hydratase/carnithine racemase
MTAGGEVAAVVAAASELDTEVQNHIAFVTLNRPAALNALSLGMVQELLRRLREYAADPEVRAVFLRGAGDKAFCAGGDVRALYRSITESGSMHRDFLQTEYRLDYFLHRYPKPVVAFMDGITMGGGMGLAQGAGLRIVGERTRLAMPEVAIGFFPDVGGSYFLSRLPGSLGPYLALTGLSIRAADALYCGLADVQVDATAAARLPTALREFDWQREPGRGPREGGEPLSPPSVLSRLVRLMREFAPPSSTDSASLAALRPAIDLHFAQSDVAAILTSLEHEVRPEYAGWAAETVRVLRSRSPLMLEVTLHELHLGKSLPLADCFRMELGMAEASFAGSEFREGVRAVLIDKDNAPRWQPSRIEDVDAASVADFFRDPYAPRVHPLIGLEQEYGHFDRRM